MSEETEIQWRISKLVDDGWTLQAIADRLEVHRVSVYEWKNGKHVPTHVNLVMMALDALADKTPPKKRRYGPDGHYMQRRAREQTDQRDTDES